jgi:single-stranded-DNA-specific exonuclease
LAEISALTTDQIQELQKFGPFGNANPKPVCAILGLQVLAVKVIGREGQHLKFTLANESGHTISAIAFRVPDFWKEIKTGDVVDVAGDLDINEWNGRSEIQLVVKDIRMTS